MTLNPFKLIKRKVKKVATKAINLSGASLMGALPFAALKLGVKVAKKIVK